MSMRTWHIAAAAHLDGALERGAQQLRALERGQVRPLCLLGLQTLQHCLQLFHMALPAWDRSLHVEWACQKAARMRAHLWVMDSAFCRVLKMGFVYHMYHRAGTRTYPDTASRWCLQGKHASLHDYSASCTMMTMI